MPLTMANSKDGHGHKKTFRYQERHVHVQYECSYIHYLEVMTNVIFLFEIGQMSRSKGLVPTERPHHKEYLCEI